MTPLLPAAVQPHVEVCAACGVVVLLASRQRAGELVLDPHECLPRMRCPCCRGRRARCQRCGGVGWIGAAMDGTRVATLDELGFARVPCASDPHRRRPGQAMHHLHECRPG